MGASGRSAVGTSIKRRLAQGGRGEKRGAASGRRLHLAVRGAPGQACLRSVPSFLTGVNQTPECSQKSDTGLPGEERGPADGRRRTILRGAPGGASGIWRFLEGIVGESDITSEIRGENNKDSRESEKLHLVRTRRCTSLYDRHSANETIFLKRQVARQVGSDPRGGALLALLRTVRRTGRRAGSKSRRGH